MVCVCVCVFVCVCVCVPKSWNQTPPRVSIDWIERMNIKLLPCGNRWSFRLCTDTFLMIFFYIRIRTRVRGKNVTLELWWTLKSVNLKKWTDIMWHLGRSWTPGNKTREEVRIMKDKTLNLEETEVSNTLGGTGEGRVEVRGKWRGCRYYFTFGKGTGVSLLLIIRGVRFRFYCYF